MRRVVLLAAVATALSGSLVAASPVAGAASPRPVVSKVSARSAGVAGGTRITITGRNFGSKTKVYFGTTKARKVKKVSSKKLRVTVPRHAGGLININVRAKNGTSKAVRADRFRFVVSPVSRLQVTRTTPTTVQLRWVNPSSSNYTSLQVRRNGRAVANLRHGTSSYVSSGLRENTRYPYAVYAYYRSTTPSAAAGINTTTANVAPGGVTAFSDTVDASTVQLSWRNPAAYDLKTIKLCRSGGTPCRNLAGGTTRFTDTSVPVGTYTYTIAAYDTANAHGPSSSVAATTTTGPQPPAIIDPSNPISSNAPDLKADAIATADPLPTAQIGGGAKDRTSAGSVAWTQAVSGNTVYVGGDFSYAMDPGSTVKVPRHNVLAYDIRDGRLITGFGDANTNGAVNSIAISPDGTRVYIGGAFTTVGGASHPHIAALDARTGKVIASFAAGVTGTGATVKALVATNSGVYAGGAFSKANGVKRANLAAFNSRGAATGWAPTTVGNVRALLMVDSKIIIGGQLTELNGRTALGIGAVTVASPGARLTWLSDQVVKNSGKSSGITSLSTDGKRVYATGFDFASGNRNLEGIFAASIAEGRILWIADCHGDSYGSYSTGGVVYTASHAHDCSSVGAFPDTNNPKIYWRTMAFTANATGKLKASANAGYKSFTNEPAPSIINWFPRLVAADYTSASQAAWSIAGNDQYIVEAGEFSAVYRQNKKVVQQGLIRFAKRGTPGATHLESGQLPYEDWLPTVTNFGLSVSIPTNYDADGMTMTYQLYSREPGGTSQPVGDPITVDHYFWQSNSTVTFPTNLAGTPTTLYRVRATDSDGNAVPSPEAHA